MSKTTIEWTNYTWNPWVGCKKVSAGCKNCYMYREQTQRGVDPMLIRKTKTMRDPFKWETTEEKRPMVFTCSYSDFFLEEADCWRDEAWSVIRSTPSLIYQVLTKRIEMVEERLPFDWPLPNVWLGVTAENQEMADKRVPILLSIPAVRRFVSVEPMLGQVDLTKIIPVDLASWSENKYAWINSLDGFGARVPSREDEIGFMTGKIHWVIAGCESGPHARSMELDWVRELREQCQYAGVPFFLKQMMVDGKLVKMPMLDGVQHAEYPSNN